MANSWKFMLKKNQLTCFLFDMNFHEYSMNFHKLLYKPFLFFYLSEIAGYKIANRPRHPTMELPLWGLRGLPPFVGHRFQPTGGTRIPYLLPSLMAARISSFSLLYTPFILLQPFFHY